MKNYKYLFRFSYWEACYCSKLSRLFQAEEYVRSWWKSRIKKIIEGDI